MNATVTQRAEEISARIDPERLKNTTLDLLRLPSPPGQERAVSEYYAAHLRTIPGLQVELDREFPESPSVIARLPGTGRGPTLQLDGHTDTIAPPGPPVRFENGFIYGRGAEDMKASLVALAEAIRVIVESGTRLKGQLLLTAHGQHESGTNETIEALIRKGIHGDAVIVAELGPAGFPIAGMGLVIFEVRLSREGEVVHELNFKAGMPNPLLAGYRLLQLLQEKNKELAAVQIPYLGAESVFVGKFQSGDYFNRVPTDCVVAGSRRYGPDRKFTDIQAEFEALARRIEQETGVKVTLSLRGNGLGSFRLKEDEPIVKTMLAAHAAVTQQALGFIGVRGVGNVSNFINSAGIPAVYYGPPSISAHSADERVELKELVLVTKVYVHAILDFLGFE